MDNKTIEKQKQSRIKYWDTKYRQGTPVWDRDYPSPLLEKAVNDKLIQPCSVISIGCGTGTNEIYLAKKGFQVTAFDLSQKAINIAINKASKDNVVVNWLCADILCLPNLSQYDLIFDRGCYHHIRYGFVSKYIESLHKLAHNDTQCLIISCNNNKAPGVNKQYIYNDFSTQFNIINLEQIDSMDHNKNKRSEWLLLMTITEKIDIK